MKFFTIIFFVLLSLANINAQFKDADWQTFRKDNITINYTDADKAEIAKITDFISNGNQTIKKFFGRKFPKSFEVRIFPDRKSLTEFWRKDWNMPDFEAQCWMVASGTAMKLTLLSPRVWKTEACEHNPDDVKDTQFVITHEMAHVFHGQMNPKPNFDGMDDVGWFVEGLRLMLLVNWTAQRWQVPAKPSKKAKSRTNLKTSGRASIVMAFQARL